MADQKLVKFTHGFEGKPEYAQAIGMISIEHSNLEIALSKLLAYTSGLRRSVAHAIYFTPRAAILRVEILQEAAKATLRPNRLASAESPLEIKKREALNLTLGLTKRAISIMGKRHEIMHDAWEVVDDDEKGSASVYRRKTKKMFGGDPVAVSELTTLFRDTRNLIKEIEKATQSFRTSPPFMADMSISSTNSESSARAVKVPKPASRKKDKHR